MNRTSPIVALLLGLSVWTCAPADAVAGQWETEKDILDGHTGQTFHMPSENPRHSAVPGRSIMAQQHVAQGHLFLAANARKEGVVTLKNGLQYKVLKAGQGRSPNAGDRVTLNYSGTLINGESIGGSMNGGKPGPASYRLEDLIPGLQEALKLMKEGDRWQVFIPSELGHRRGKGPLELRALIFDLALLAVDGSDAKAKNSRPL